MEIEVKVTATTEVAVDVTVTPVDGRFPGPPDAPRYRFLLATILSSNASTIRSRGTAFRNRCRIGLQARIQDSPRRSVWPTRTISSFPKAACFFNTRAPSCSTP
jgi:hypothetical protein